MTDRHWCEIGCRACVPEGVNPIPFSGITLILPRDHDGIDFVFDSNRMVRVIQHAVPRGFEDSQ